MVITIAPSDTQAADPEQTPIVAFVRPCGRIDREASGGPTLPTIDKIDKCYELSLTQLDLQHLDYLMSPQAQTWQRQANLPILQADADTANTPPTPDTPDPTKRKAPPTAADNLHDRHRQRHQIRELQSIVRDLTDMTAPEQATLPAATLAPTTPITPARQVAPTAERNNRPRDEVIEPTPAVRKKPRNRPGKGLRQRQTAQRHRGH